MKSLNKLFMTLSLILQAVLNFSRIIAIFSISLSIITVNAKCNVDGFISET